MRGAYETAAFEAMREVEIASRRCAGYAEAAHSMPTMKKAFNPESGPLTDYTVDIAEREAMRDLFAGAIGSYKNPHSHRHEPIDSPRVAIEIILLASCSARVMDSGHRHPTAAILHHYGKRARSEVAQIVGNRSRHSVSLTCRGSCRSASQQCSASCSRRPTSGLNLPERPNGMDDHAPRGERR
jgi:uncharacterized protein (TIGR02391 family)